jgi:hypothetical protein
MRTLGCLHLGVPLTLGSDREGVSPEVLRAYGGTLLRLSAPRSPLRRGWWLPQALVTSTSPAA